MWSKKKDLGVGLEDDRNPDLSQLIRGTIYEESSRLQSERFTTKLQALQPLLLQESIIFQ